MPPAVVSLGVAGGIRLLELLEVGLEGGVVEVARVVVDGGDVGLELAGKGQPGKLQIAHMGS